MQNLNPEIVCNLIDRAREFHAKEGVVIPDDTPTSPSEINADVLEEHQEDAIYQEFKLIIGDLEPDQQVALVALMWVGRGDFGEDEWNAAFQQAGEQWTPHTAEYLLSTPMVADYLSEGLATFGYSCES